MTYELRFELRSAGGWRYGGRYRTHRQAARAMHAVRCNWRVRRAVLVRRR